MGSGSSRPARGSNRVAPSSKPLLSASPLHSPAIKSISPTGRRNVVTKKRVVVKRRKRVKRDEKHDDVTSIATLGPKGGAAASERLVSRRLQRSYTKGCLPPTIEISPAKKRLPGEGTSPSASQLASTQSRTADAFASTGKDDTESQYSKATSKHIHFAVEPDARAASLSHRSPTLAPPPLRGSESGPIILSSASTTPASATPASGTPSASASATATATASATPASTTPASTTPASTTPASGSHSHTPAHSQKPTSASGGTSASPSATVPSSAGPGSFGSGAGKSSRLAPQLSPPPTSGPVPGAGRRRGSISAESISPSAGDSTAAFAQQAARRTPFPAVPIRAEEIGPVKALLSSNFLFKGLDPELFTQVVGRVVRMAVPAGAVLIRQGDGGDFFYAMASGLVEITVSGRKVLDVVAGGSFGELALMYNTPRAATCTAAQDSVVWALDRQTFQSAVVHSHHERKASYVALLQQVPLFCSLAPTAQQRIADSLDRITYSEGETVVRQGDPGDSFYLIERGVANVFQARPEISSVVQIGSLSSGMYFGEIALVRSQPRVASVVAGSRDLVCARMSAEAFARVIGPLRAQLEPTIDAYKSWRTALKESKGAAVLLPGTTPLVDELSIFAPCQEPSSDDADADAASRSRSLLSSGATKSPTKTPAPPKAAQSPQSPQPAPPAPTGAAAAAAALASAPGGATKPTGVASVRPATRFAGATRSIYAMSTGVGGFKSMGHFTSVRVRMPIRSLSGSESSSGSGGAKDGPTGFAVASNSSLSRDRSSNVKFDASSAEGEDDAVRAADRARRHDTEDSGSRSGRARGRPGAVLLGSTPRRSDSMTDEGVRMAAR